MTAEQVIEALRLNGYYTTDGHFRLVSGKHSDTYVQARVALMDPNTCGLFDDSAVSIIRKTNPDYLAAFTIGGLLLAKNLSDRLQIPLLVGRKAVRGVEWLNRDVITPQTRLLLIDDVLTTTSQLNEATTSLDTTSLGSLVAVLVAVDRTTTSPDVIFRGEAVLVYGCMKIPLPLYDPSSCELCRAGVPPRDLSNPETDVISVLLSQPTAKSDFILNGYEKVWRMQEETQHVEEIHAWRLWLPVFLAGLPLARLEEDSRLIRFVKHLTSVAQACGVRPRVPSEIVGQLVSLSSVRVESRPLGCSLLVGDPKEIRRTLESEAWAKLPSGASCEKLTDLVPYFDGFLETEYVIVLDRDGNVLDFRRLVSTLPRVKHLEGIELLRHVTSLPNCIGFVLRRGRSALSIYWKGKLEAIGELSERTGLWEFGGMERLDEINRLVPGIDRFLVHVVEAARELVARRYGALFVVGDSEGLEHTKPKVEIEPQRLEDWSTVDIVELAKLDGAVVINKEGRLQRATVIIHNKDSEEGTMATRPTGHGGSRKETARRTSLECPNAVAVYVSQNGVIELYVRGNSYPLTQAMSGLART